MSQPDWKPTAKYLATLYEKYEDIGKDEVTDHIESALKEAYAAGWTDHYKAVTENPPPTLRRTP